MRLLCAFLLVLALLPASAAPVPVPWKDGETLDYRIRWGAVLAASAHFTARQDADGWRFALDLRTRGPVEAMHPIRSLVYSVTRADPWRSVAYGDDRFAGGKWRAASGWIDYAARSGSWHEDKDGATTDTPFPVPDPAVNDIGSMLYGLRLVAWKEGVPVPWRVYNGPEIEKAEASLLRREKIAPAEGGPEVSCLVVRVRPVYADAAKDAKGYGVTLWITDDARRLPLRADLKARFGTFTLDWVTPGAIETPKQ